MFKMKYDLVQLIKDRCKLLEDNPKASDMLHSFLKHNYSSEITEIDEYGMDLSDNMFIRVVKNDIFITSTEGDTLEGEDIKLTLSLNDSCSLSYYNYFKTDNHYVIQSFRMSFTNGEITLANIGEWKYSKETPKISDYIYITLLNIHDFNYNFYRGIKDGIINEIYTDERILPDAYKELFIDTNRNKVSLNIDNATSEEEFDDNLFALINKFSSIETNGYVDSINGYIDTRRQKMTDILLKINDVLENNYTPKERQYILLNGSRKK